MIKLNKKSLHYYLATECGEYYPSFDSNICEYSRAVFKGLLFLLFIGTLFLFALSTIFYPLIWVLWIGVHWQFIEPDAFVFISLVIWVCVLIMVILEFGVEYIVKSYKKIKNKKEQKKKSDSFIYQYIKSVRGKFCTKIEFIDE